MSWYKAKGSGGQYLIIDEDTGHTVAVVYNSGNEEETELDAEIITQAKEMYKALIEINDVGILGTYEKGLVNSILSDIQY